MTALATPTRLVRGCTGKQRLPSSTVAWRIVKRMNRRPREDGETPFQAYFCGGCGAWHIEHKDRK